MTFFNGYIIDYPNLSRFAMMFGFGIFTQIPITFVRNIEVLYKISTLGTFALMYTLVVSIIEFPFYFNENYSYAKLKLWDLNWNIVKIICMYIFAYANHNAILNVVREVKEPTQEKGKKIVYSAFYIEFSVYLLVLITGYLSTFDETNEIFIDRKENNVFMFVGKILYMVALTCHIGLLYFISIPSIEMLVNSGNQFNQSQ
jgi:amino acid permease